MRLFLTLKNSGWSEVVVRQTKRDPHRVIRGGRLALGIAAALSAAAPAFAQEAADGYQAEWAQSYDVDAQLQVKRSTVPVLSQQTVAATEGAIATYQALVAKGGWGTVPSANLHVGSKGAGVVALRRRLMVTRDLDEAAGISPVFDSYVAAGVKRFQARHGISESGTVTPETAAELNVPADMRLRQLETNLVRLRSFSGDLGARSSGVFKPARDPAPDGT